MKVSIVIPNWNGSEKLRRNLPKVLEAARANNIEEIIISDDASTDDSVKLLKSEFSEAIVIESGKAKNEGFSSNVNRGVKKATGDLIFLLNSDATPGKDFLKSVLPHFETPKVFSVGCNTGGLWAIGEFKDGFFWHNQAQKPSTCEAEAHKTLWVSGGSGFFRKSVWEELGGLDILFDPFYLEDLDLGYRAWKRDYINMWEPKSLVEHYKEKGVIEGNFSKSAIQNTSDRNLLIFIWKNITSRKMVSDHKIALIKMLLKHPKYWLIFSAALLKLPKIMEKRKVESRAAKLTDEEVLSIFAQTPV